MSDILRVFDKVNAGDELHIDTPKSRSTYRILAVLRHPLKVRIDGSLEVHDDDHHLIRLIFSRSYPTYQHPAIVSAQLTHPWIISESADTLTLEGENLQKIHNDLIIKTRDWLNRHQKAMLSVAHSLCTSCDWAHDILR